MSISQSCIDRIDRIIKKKKQKHQNRFFFQFTCHLNMRWTPHFVLVACYRSIAVLRICFLFFFLFTPIMYAILRWMNIIRSEIPRTNLHNIPPRAYTRQIYDFQAAAIHNIYKYHTQINKQKQNMYLYDEEFFRVVYRYQFKHTHSAEKNAKAMTMDEFFWICIVRCARMKTATTHKHTRER